MHVDRVSVMPANAVTQVTAHAGEDVEKGEHSSIVGGSTNCTVTLEINMVVSQKKKWESLYLKTQLYHSWAYAQRTLYHTTWTLAQLCSQ